MIMYLFVFIGCFGSETEEVTFPSDLTPLEENLSTWPTDQSEDVIVVGGESEEGYYWAHARGYVHSSIENTWEALQDPAVNVDRRRVDEWTVTELYEPEYDISYVIHYVVNDIVTIEYDVQWRHGALGTPDSPEKVGIRFIKSDGSSYIESMIGSILIWEENGITLFEAEEHLDAILVSEEEPIQYLTDLYHDVLSYTKGDPLQQF